MITKIPLTTFTQNPQEKLCQFRERCYTLNVWSWGKQLVLFSWESWGQLFEAWLALTVG